MKIVAVFDFDHSLIPMNSDTEIVQLLMPELMSEFHTLRSKHPVWTDVMDSMFEKLHVLGGVNEERMCHALHKMKPWPLICESMVALFEANADIVILSDANSVFIQEILKSSGVFELFGERIHVITNPAYFESSGRLRVDYHHVNLDCQLCPKNLCKGRALQDLLKKHYHHYRHNYEYGEPLSNQKDPQLSSASSSSETHSSSSSSSVPPESLSMLYLGDGSGDYCPILGLGPTDVALVRQDFPLHKLVCKHSNNQQHQVHEHQPASDATTPSRMQLRSAIKTWQSGHDIFELIDLFIATTRTKASSGW